MDGWRLKFAIQGWVLIRRTINISFAFDWLRESGVTLKDQSKSGYEVGTHYLSLRDKHETKTINPMTGPDWSNFVRLQLMRMWTKACRRKKRQLFNLTITSFFASYIYVSDWNFYYLIIIALSSNFIGQDVH